MSKALWFECRSVRDKQRY